MGAKNVNKVFVYWSKSDLTHRELVALLYMANISLDADTPPVYFAGWQPIADSVGLNGEALNARADPDASALDKRQAKSVEEQVRRIMKKLIQSGAIVSAGDARRGTATDYALCLDPGITFRPTGRTRTEGGRYRMTWARVDNSNSPTEKEGQESTDSEGQTPPNRRGNIHRKGGHSPTEKEGPKSKEDPYKENADEPHHFRDHLTCENSTAGATNDESELSLEEERNRQTEALRQLMNAEPIKDTSAA